MYKVLQEYTTTALERKVIEYMRNGYKCVGGISSTTSGGGVLLYCQAMVEINIEEIKKIDKSLNI